MQRTYYLYEGVGDGHQHLITDKKRDPKKFGHPEREDRATLVNFVGQLTLDGYPSDRMIIDVSDCCNKCWGEMGPSRAYMDVLKAQEFGPDVIESKLVDCMKCASCGHSYETKEKR